MNKIIIQNFSSEMSNFEDEKHTVTFLNDSVEL